MDEQILHIQNSMYQYSRAIYRSIKDSIDPYVDNTDLARPQARRLAILLHRRSGGLRMSRRRWHL